jgi:hypothetical protein
MKIELQIVEAGLRALRAERDALRERCFEIYVECGEDTDGARKLSDMGRLTPDIDELALRAVKELRGAYDEACDELNVVPGKPGVKR